MTGNFKPFTGWGTLVNTVSVIVGTAVGLAVGGVLPPSMQQLVMAGIGLVTLGMGIKLFLGSKNILVLVASLCIGGMIGSALHLHDYVLQFADWSKATFGGQGSSTFAEAVVTTSILFCVGPMTLMGCLQEAIEGKRELIYLKSMLDGFSSLFFAVSLGAGVFVSALVVLVVQGAITLLGQRLKFVADRPELLDEASAVGGPIMMGIGLGILNIKSIPVSNFVPALVLAPVLVAAQQKWANLKHPAD